ncbi:MAG: UDP-glucuronic acid decarboxylase family protein [Bacteroidales bacterium]|nr:UDP-glucuronic acid decarboxylase family protein [Bacteroidales bacterium]
MNILVTGGAGFIGSNLCHKLYEQGHNVYCIDNLYTGRKKNIADLIGKERFYFVEADICDFNEMTFENTEKFDRIYNLACPASPPAYQKQPIHTTMTCTVGMYNMLCLAEQHKARLLQASTSEVYGDPDISPQSEDYRGNVNCTGIRSCYDEGKRCAESLCFDFQRAKRADVRVVRIFNTYGPNMRADDGRVLTNMIEQAATGKPITVYGNGSQTRSFCYVDDTVNGLIKVMESDYIQPVNIGNPEEHTIKEMAELIKQMTHSESEIVYKPLPLDDPKKRKPDITVAKSLGWKPETELRTGLNWLMNYLQGEIQ